MDTNTKKLKKNAFRITKERGLTASRVRVPGGHLKAEYLGKLQHIAEEYGNGSKQSFAGYNRRAGSQSGILR